MSSIQSVLSVQVLIDSTGGGAAGRIVFSPGKPKTAVVLFEDAPPQVHDFGKAVLRGDREEGYVTELSASTLVTNDQGKPVSFRDPACAVAYRPGSDELSIVFRSAGEEVHDSTVWRFNPVSGSPLPSVYFDNPTAVSYSADGALLAVGGEDGIVTVFRVDGCGETFELCTVSVSGAVRSMVFEDFNRQLYVATENNMLVSFLYEFDDNIPVQRGVEVEGGDSITNMCLTTLAYSESSNLIATAGVGNEVWVSNPLTCRGRMLRLRQANRIHSVQFDEQSDTLIAFSDAGVELVAFSVDAEQLPVFEERTVRFSPLLEMVGCHHYGDFLFVASLV